MLGSAFVFGGQYALGSAPVGPVSTGVALYADGQPLSFAEGSLALTRSLSERSSLSFQVINSSIPLTDGQRIVLMRGEERLFSGHIWSVNQHVSENKQVSSIDLECVDIAQAMDRQIKLKTYTDQSAKMILLELLATDLNAEGIWAGHIDEGPRFPLVDADNTRVSELVRDVADGAGMTLWIDPHGFLHSRSALVDTAPFAIQAGTARAIDIQNTKDTYKNVVVVECASQDGQSSVLVERMNATEIADRAAREGGTGRYEVFSKIQHPTSNDPSDMQRLAIAFSIIALSRSNTAKRILTCTVFAHGLNVGQILTVNLPEYQASGTWTITQVTMTQLVGAQFQYRIEALQSSILDRIYDAYLKIVGAGRATVQLPIGILSNIEEFFVDTDWTVPGSGAVEVEIDGFGPGGGGGGYDGVGPNGTGASGGIGGTGGKAVTFLSLAAGTVVNLVIPAAGSGGLGANPTTVNFTSPGTTAWVVPGTGNVRVEMTVKGAGGGGGGDSTGLISPPNSPSAAKPGGAGGLGKSWRVYAAGTVLDVVVGAGGAGGDGGDINSAGQAGAFSRVSLSGVTIAQGNGGGGGDGETLLPPANPGAPGTGIGDQATTGGGAGGGAAGIPEGGAGSAGSHGSVTIRYADPGDGTAGGNVTASIGGILKMQATGGGGGLSGVDGGGAGANNGGIGDQVTVGGGSAGGAGGTAANLNGSAGQPGKIQIRY